MMSDLIVYETTTLHNHYQVVDMVYDDRQARVLFSGKQQAAQSGLAQDGGPDLLFDYNQRLVELVDSLQSKRILLIGGGIYSLPTRLLSLHPQLFIDVVELDSGLDAIAADYFDFQPHTHLKIIHMEGRQFIETAINTYDLIIVDAFAHDMVPRQLVTKEAIRRYRQLLLPHGCVAVNVISSLYGRNSEILQRQYAGYSKLFRAVDIFPASHTLLSYWLPQNFLLVARQDSVQPLNLRYDSLELAERDVKEPWYDHDFNSIKTEPR